MSNAAASVGSVRKRLLRVLMMSLLGLVVLAVSITHEVADSVANDAYDHGLLDPVLDIAANVEQTDSGPHFALSAREQEALLFDGTDQLFFQVRDPTGAHLAGNPDVPRYGSALSSGKPVFYNGQLDHAPVRVCGLRTKAGFEVYVAETMNKRQRLEWEIILAEFVPSLVIVAVAIALVWFGVTHGLRPLHRLRLELQRRSPQDLEPLDVSQVPEEVQPATQALNRLFQRIRETSESQRRFLENAAHQLRTPLAGLQMQLELELRDATSERLKIALSKMRDAVLRSGRVANRLLALARAEQVTPETHQMVSVDLAAIAQRVGASWIRAAIARDIDLGFDLSPAIVSGHEPLLAEMLDNLIDNAIRYTPPHGVVTLTSRTSSAGAVLTVEDNGVGIPLEERERVFERFYRGKRAEGDGTGLGLAIVREVAERHGAAISIAVPASGRGTLITIQFPRATAPSDGPSHHPTSEATQLSV